MYGNQTERIVDYKTHRKLLVVSPPVSRRRRYSFSRSRGCCLKLLQRYTEYTVVVLYGCIVFACTIGCIVTHFEVIVMYFGTGGGICTRTIGAKHSSPQVQVHDARSTIHTAPPRCPIKPSRREQVLYIHHCSLIAIFILLH